MSHKENEQNSYFHAWVCDSGESWRVSKYNIPGFAAGGNYSGGVALVGEKGPELINFHRGGYVYNAQDSKRLLQSGDTYHQISVPVSVAGESSPRLAGRLRAEITELVQRIIYEEARA